jgi:hypothetical protein
MTCSTRDGEIYKIYVVGFLEGKHRYIFSAQQEEFASLVQANKLLLHFANTVVLGIGAHWDYYQNFVFPRLSRVSKWGLFFDEKRCLIIID